EHARVRELLIELHGELEAGRRPLGPRAADLRARLPVERRVHFDRVEVLRVVRELVEPVPPRLRIEDAVPRALAGRIVPPGRPDPQQLAHLIPTRPTRPI